ncbi:MAG: PAS domain-containing protein, partial [Opitutaceae bacterium]|nr:PAS domain-containing protein [Opitutaceae bacterium]
MTPPPPASAPSPAAIPPVAVLMLDAAGMVVAANAAAHAFWGVEPGRLNGEAFVRLFEFEIVSDEPDWLDTQWAAVLATARDQVAPFIARDHEGRTHAVIVRLEQPPGLAERHLATVQAPADTTRRLPTDDTLVPQLAEHGPIGFFDLNPATGEAWYSPAWKKMLGYVHGELPDTHASWLELLHPEDTTAAPFLPGKSTAAGPRPFDVEFRLRHRRGHYVWIHCVGVQVIDEAGQLTRVYGFHLDITERKETEEASLAGDQRLRTLSEAGPLGAFELDFTGGRSWFSAAWWRLLGHEPQEADHATTGPFLAALPRGAAEAGLDSWVLALEPGRSSFLVPVRLQLRDGSTGSFLLGAHRTLNRKRQLQRLTGFLCALPAVGAETAPAALGQEALAAVAEAVVLTDPRGVVLAANPAAARLLRLPPEQLVGRAFEDVFPLIHRESGQPADGPVALALAAEAPLPLSSLHALAYEGGPPVPLVWTARPVFEPGGRARGVVVIFRNPDELSLTPDELVKSNRFEALGLLAGGIAHDFNNLLTTILGGISLAKDNRDYSALADAEQACLTAKGLTRQLLTVAKGGTGSLIVAAVPELLRDAVKIAAAGSNVPVAVEAPDTVAPVAVDRSQMLQVFQNLIVNALQAMPPPPHEPRVQIRAANTAVTENQIAGLDAGDYVEIEVRDNGGGIPPENLEKIFDPFFTTKKHGTGLGLATVLSLVRKHGGQIAVDSAVGTGTVFTVFLPRARQSAE